MQKIVRSELIKSNVAGGCNKASQAGARANNTNTIVVYVTR
jgi:hypothetical protein